MSWIVRISLAGGRHEHGYSGGAVSGYLSHRAQVSSNRGGGQYVVTDNDYYEPVGFGLEGPDDGYSPFGVGDFGYGYGAAQQQYKEVQKVL